MKYLWLCMAVVFTAMHIANDRSIKNLEMTRPTNSVPDFRRTIRMHKRAKRDALIIAIGSALLFALSVAGIIQY